jgi:hypothetical protein
MDQYHSKNEVYTAGTTENPTIVHALCVLAFASECGTNPEALAARSRIGVDLIQQIADRMRNAGLWSDDGVDQSEWWNASGEFPSCSTTPDSSWSL